MNKKGFGIIALVVVAIAAFVVGGFVINNLVVAQSPGGISSAFINAHECTRDGTCEVNTVLVKACSTFVDSRIIVKAIEETTGGDGVALKEGDKVFERNNLIVPQHILEVQQISNSTVGFNNDVVKFEDLISGGISEAVITAEGVGTVDIGGNTYNLNYIDDPLVDADEYVVLDYPQTTNPQRKMDLSLCF